ncbi:MAG: hypothetical protein ACR2GL_06990 [Thermoleophilaceae bacterium]
MLAVVVFALSRGGDKPLTLEERASNQALSSATALGSVKAESELERRSEALEAKAERKLFSSDLRGTEDKIDRIDDLGWRAFDEQFRRSPFDRGIDKLPLRKPPLDVVQWVTDSPPDPLRTKAQRERFYGMSQRAREAAVRKYYRSGPHKLYARVDRRRFFGMSKRARAAAVRAFYRDARPFFKKAGIKDFVLVVTPWSKTTEHLPAYAVGRGGSATLTPLGRGESAGV